MAKWLNAILSGSASVTVFRNGVAVDPAAFGATLTTTGGVVTLTTPNVGGNLWKVKVTPSYLTFAAPMRLRSISASHPLGITAASVVLTTASGAETTQALATTPTVSPDPAQPTGSGVNIQFTVTEDTV